MENNEQQEDLIVKTIKEEYEKKLQKQKEEYEKKLADVKDEEEKKSVAKIKALMSGRTEINDTDKNEEQEEQKSYYEIALEETRKKIKELI